jgi:hypothetical protein
MKKVRLPVALAVVILASAVVWRVVQTHYAQQGTSFRSEQRTASPPPTPANYGQPSPLPTAAPAGGAPVLTEQHETEQRLGPFQITGQNYSVVLHKKRLPQNGDVPAVDGVVSMEIVDAAGTVLNQRTFPLWAEEDLHASWSVFAGPLIGSNGRGLIVKYGANVDEDAARNAPYSQIFGVLDGKFVPFGGPVTATFSSPDADGTYHTMQTLSSQADGLPFVIGTGRFVLIGRVLIDWTQGKLSLPPQCASVIAGPAGVCAYQMQDPQAYLRRPTRTTFVQLYADPDENSGPRKRIAVKPNSKINLLTAAANLELKQLNSVTAPFGANDPMKDQLRVQAVPYTEVWLRVDVDGNQGWLRGNEDLDSVGLPESEDD